MGFSSVPFLRVICRQGRETAGLCAGQEETMYRFFVPVENISGEKICITGDDVNHIRNVLRMRSGEKVVVSCGRGTDYFCAIESLETDRIILRVEQERQTETELPVRITLFQALPKKDKMEFVIQKAVELGASEIVPVMTKRCVVRLDEKKEAKRRERWQGIAEAAAKQSGRGVLPQIRPVADFAGALELAENMDTVLIPYELCGDMSESAAALERAVRGDSIGIFIGPEGGFERGEVEQAVGRGALPISLGRRILRTETAGLAALSVLMFWIEQRER